MKTAFVFPGQGSQSVGMLADAAERWSVVEETFSQASEVLGYDLWQRVQQGPESDLNQTVVTQPALLTASVALWRCWEQEGGVAPVMMAGHSLGEYSALVAAGSLAFHDAVALVRLRAEAMQQAVPDGEGRMAAILGLADDQVLSACEQAAEGDVVTAVNFNAPGQVVIAGAAAAVERAINACKDAGAKRAMALPVSVPSHCELMRPAADTMAEALTDVRINNAKVPVVQNVSAEPATAASVIAENLVRQLYSPVRWTDSVQNLLAAGCDQFHECGPGRVLSGLIKRIERRTPCQPLDNPDALSEAAQSSQGA